MCLPRWQTCSWLAICYWSRYERGIGVSIWPNQGQINRRGKGLAIRPALTSFTVRAQRKAQIEQLRGFLVFEGVLARASLTVITIVSKSGKSFLRSIIKRKASTCQATNRLTLRTFNVTHNSECRLINCGALLLVKT